MKNILFIAFTFCILFRVFAQKTIGSVDRIDPEINSLIAEDAVIEILADGFSWAEGPVWVSELDAVLFSDVPKNKIYKWNQQEGYQDYISPSGFTNYAPVIPNIGLSGANGLTFDNDGNLIIAQHGDRRLSIIDNSPTTNPNFTTIVDNYEGSRFNSPNDVVV